MALFNCDIGLLKIPKTRTLFSVPFSKRVQRVNLGYFRPLFSTIDTQKGWLRGWKQEKGTQTPLSVLVQLYYYYSYYNIKKKKKKQIYREKIIIIKKLIKNKTNYRNNKNKICVFIIKNTPVNFKTLHVNFKSQIKDKVEKWISVNQWVTVLLWKIHSTFLCPITMLSPPTVGW